MRTAPRLVVCLQLPQPPSMPTAASFKQSNLVMPARYASRALVLACDLIQSVSLAVVGLEAVVGV
jgi:hypothetical protein